MHGPGSGRGYRDVRQPRFRVPDDQRGWAEAQRDRLLGWQLVRCQIDVRTRNFAGLCEADLRADEFERLHAGLEHLIGGARGHATFDSLESWLVAEIDADGLGHLRMKYTVVARHCPRLALESFLEFDQAQLPTVLEQLERILTSFPVLGERPD